MQVRSLLCVAAVAAAALIASPSYAGGGHNGGGGGARAMGHGGHGGAIGRGGINRGGINRGIRRGGINRGLHRAGIRRFHGNFRNWSPRHRAFWRRGHWWHGRHRGRLGWWWFAGGSWYWYPAAVYPYPTYASAYAVDGGSGGTWYYCKDPEGYYPYVRSCNANWQPVPAQPNMEGGGSGTPPGYDDGNSDDQGAGNEGADSEDAQGDEAPDGNGS